MRVKTDTMPCADATLLTQHEIDRRIELVVSEIAAVAETHAVEDSSERPRWITAAELVRRVRPFIVLN